MLCNVLLITSGGICALSCYHVIGMQNACNGTASYYSFFCGNPVIVLLTVVVTVTVTAIMTTAVTVTAAVIVIEWLTTATGTVTIIG